MQKALQGAGGFDPVQFYPDTRAYRAEEVLEHFAVSYRSPFLGQLAKVAHFFGAGAIRVVVHRPEQFVAVVRRAGDAAGERTQ